MSNLEKFGEYGHQATLLARASRKFGLNSFFAFLTGGQLASTVTIFNKTISNDSFNEVTSGLSNVVSWRLSLRSGNDFSYAFVAAPSVHATAFGWAADVTPIAEIHVKRVESQTEIAELVVWTL